MQTELHWRRLSAAGFIAAAQLMLACGPDATEVLDCEDLVPIEEASFDAVANLVVGPGPKSCGLCHTEESPVNGFDFSSRDATYDALVNKMHLIYPQVATASMPQGTVPWEEQDLQLLRSWYCHGAFYDAS